MNTLNIKAIREELSEKLKDRYEVELFSHLKINVAERYLNELEGSISEFEFSIYESYSGSLIVARNK